MQKFARIIELENAGQVLLRYYYSHESDTWFVNISTMHDDYMAEIEMEFDKEEYAAHVVESYTELAAWHFRRGTSGADTIKNSNQKQKNKMQAYKISRNYKELKIRFFETEKIDPSVYPIDLVEEDGYLNSGTHRAIITEDMVRNSNGLVFRELPGGKEIWATALVTHIPENWVVEKDEKHPRWEDFQEFFSLRHGAEVNFNFNYYGSGRGPCDDELTYFSDHQLLTLDQWARLFLPEEQKPKGPEINDKDWFVMRGNEDVSIAFKGGVVTGHGEGYTLARTEMLVCIGNPEVIIRHNHKIEKLDSSAELAIMESIAQSLKDFITDETK